MNSKKTPISISVVVKCLVGILILGTVVYCGTIDGELAATTIPVITSISPSSAIVYGGIALTLSGTGFDASSSVAVDGSNCPVTNATATGITCTAPAHADGSAKWIVTNSAGNPSSPYSAFTYIPPAAILGQASATSSLSGNGVSALNQPTGVFTDGTRVVVADSGNNRVLLWNSIPTSNGQAANIVLGQADFTHTASNQGGSLGANTLNGPVDVSIYGNKLLVSDVANNRVLIWNSIPLSNGQSADVVIGQPNMTTAASNSGGIGPNTLNNPWGIGIDSNTGELYISDILNNRALYFSSIPTTNFVNANYVLGQPNFTSYTSGTNQSRLKIGYNGYLEEMYRRQIITLLFRTQIIAEL